jgi:hypothetical protein
MGASKKQAEGAKRKSERESAIRWAQQKTGKAISDMTKAEQEQFTIIIGQLLGLVDVEGKIKG